MALFTWLQNCKRNFDGKRRGGHGSPRQQTSFRPRLEVLESRNMPSTLSVTNNLASGPGSLRWEVAVAQVGDTIIFAKGVTGAISLGGVEIIIDKDLDIEGPGANKLAISGNGGSRVFEVAPTAHVTISGLTIKGGDGTYGGTEPDPNDGKGGGILNWGALTLSGCTVSSNTNTLGLLDSDLGGGIYNAGELTLNGCTVKNNSAGHGGGIYNDSTGILTVLSSSVTQNPGFDLYNLGRYTKDNHSKIGDIGP